MRMWKRSIIVAAVVGALCAPTFAMASQANSFGDMSFTSAQLTEFKARPHRPGPPPPPPKKAKKPKPPKKIKKPAPRPHKPAPRKPGRPMPPPPPRPHW